jgi:cobalamin biosynthesis Mg chelatase CobN
MQLSDLTPEEQIALVALLRLTIGSDAQVSEDERAEIQRVVEAIGGESYRRAVEAADTRFADEQELRRWLPTISRPAARELIFETVLESALPGVVDKRENSVLTWLARAWGLKVHPQSS